MTTYKGLVAENNLNMLNKDGIYQNNIDIFLKNLWCSLKY